MVGELALAAMEMAGLSQKGNWIGLDEVTRG